MKHIEVKDNETPTGFRPWLIVNSLIFKTDLEDFWIEENKITLSPGEIIIVEGIQSLKKSEIYKCGYCHDSRKIRCLDPECYTCAMDYYCDDAKDCKYCQTVSQQN